MVSVAENTAKEFWINVVEIAHKLRQTYVNCETETYYFFEVK